ncbi:unnamed protein product [Candidula unifasciata]|uniref:Uncharacterized protein n=1 Tax=Candidula unifasciata TaxID=100452 RepID=A0A8S3ZIH7_9EUPU|nr:unnamed protein product [Candidula unifasciata]
MPTSPGGPVLATARPSTRQASSSNFRSESSAARCRVFQRRDQKLLKAKTQPQLENAQLRYRVNFTYSARCPVSMPANNTAKPTALSTRVYPGGCLAYIRYLQWIIRLIVFQMDLFHQSLEKSIRRLHRIIDSDTVKLKNRVKIMKCKRVKGNNLVKGLQSLNAKKDSVKTCSKRTLNLLHVRKRLCDDSIRVEIRLLDSKLAPLPQGVVPQRKFVDSKMASNTRDFNEKMKRLTSRYSSFCKMFSDDFMVVDI